MALNMLFLIGLIIKNGILAKLFAYSFGIILALSLYAFCRRFLTKTAGLFAAMILYTLPIVVEYTVQAYVDIGTALFTLLAYHIK